MSDPTPPQPVTLDPFSSICDVPTKCYKYPPQALIEAILRGELLGEVNGHILTEPAVFRDTYNGITKFSLRGMVNGRQMAWAQCGCGVKHCIRGIPNPDWSPTNE